MIRTVKRGQRQAAGAVHFSVGRESSGTGARCRPLHALANGESRNGVYVYGAAPAFPTSEWNSTNYWVDVLFVPAST